MPGASRESSEPGASLGEPYKNGNIKVAKDRMREIEWRERSKEKRDRLKREIDWRERSIARTIDLKHIV